MWVYKRWFAARLASDPSASDPLIVSHKTSLLKNIRGKVLEIGPGTGNNMRYFPKNLSWYGLEPNPFMEQYLRKEAAKHGLKTFHLQLGTAEHIPFPALTFDAAVCTHVLCSVENPAKAVSEIHRILKKGGIFYFLEHVKSEEVVKQIVQNILSPVWSLIADGCHPNRDIEGEIRKTIFRELEVVRFKANLPIISAHIVGRAIK